MKDKDYNPRNLKYQVKITIDGYPAEIIDELAASGLYGGSRAEVVKNLAFSKIEMILKDRLLENIRELQRKRDEHKK